MADEHASVPANDMWWFLLTSARYSFGRVSYAASLTADLVRRYRRLLTAHQQEQLAREIRDDLRLRSEYEFLPADIVRTWEGLALELERPIEPTTRRL